LVLVVGKRSALYSNRSVSEYSVHSSCSKQSWAYSLLFWKCKVHIRVRSISSFRIFREFHLSYTISKCWNGKFNYATVVFVNMVSISSSRPPFYTTQF